MELMASGSPCPARAKSSGRSTPRRLAMISRNLPVPAEHLSFIKKLEAMPPSTVITLVSWPPISTTVQSRPSRANPPFPWQVISVTVLAA